MKSKKVGLFWYDWYSICSKHLETEKDGCRLCETGSWESRWSVWWSNLFFKLWPWAWRKWANRR